MFSPCLSFSRTEMEGKRPCLFRCFFSSASRNKQNKEKGTNKQFELRASLETGSMPPNTTAQIVPLRVISPS